MECVPEGYGMEEYVSGSGARRGWGPSEGSKKSFEIDLPCTLANCNILQLECLIGVDRRGFDDDAGACALVFDRVSSCF